MSHCKVTVTKEIRREWTFTTEEIEALIVEALNLKGEAFTFNWHVGQWVELTLSSRKTEVIE